MMMTAKQAHRNCAMFLGIFLALHFAAHFAAFFGIERHDQALQWGRAIYQFPVVETALGMALLLQIGLGIKLLKQIAKRPQKGFWHWAQFVSGAYLVYFIVMHSSAAIGTRLLIGLDTNFYWAAGTLVLAPLKYGFAPYYVLAVTALATHILAALHYRGPRQWHRLALGLGPLIGIAIVLAYSGALYGVSLPQEHLDYFATYLPVW